MINSINEEKQFQKANDLFDKMDRTKTREGRATVVEYTKKGDNATFGVVREGSQYTIKVTNKKSPVLVAEDFDYIESYEARKRFQRTTLQEAIKYLHLYLNEEKYVVDVPVVTQTAPEPEMDAPQMDGGMGETPPMDGEMGDEMDANMDGEMGDEGAGSDDQKEIQKMTGKLAQELRQEIADGNGPFTVGMFKSLIAPAKDLTPDLKSKVMDKAQEVLSGDEEGGGDTENAEMDAMNETIMNLKKLLSEEKKEKVFTEEQVEKMILSQVGSINKLKNAYKTVIDDPEVQKLLDTVYHKLFKLKSIQERKKELHGKEKKEAMKKESAVQSTISHIKKNREMAEEATAIMRTSDYNKEGKKVTGQVIVVPDSNMPKMGATLKESKKITLKEFKDMMEEESPENSWEKYQKLFGITKNFQDVVDELKKEFRINIKGSMEAFDDDVNEMVPVVEDIRLTYSPKEDGRTATMSIVIEPFSSGERVLIYVDRYDLEIKQGIIHLFKKMEEQMKELGVL